MITNGINFPEGHKISTDVCIVGSGPAGITAAWHLYKNGIKNVTLIEGSRDFRDQDFSASWEDKVLLYDGVADGLFEHNEPKFLTRPYDGSKGPWERERVFGGTSAHWACQCRPLDPITFEGREGYPGWPITRTDLDYYYAKAGTFLNLYGDFSTKDWTKFFCANYWAKELGTDYTAPKLEAFDTEMYQFLDYNDRNFATKEFEPGKTIADLVDVILNASLLRIEHDGRTVSRLHVASMELKVDEQNKPKLKKAKDFTIEAKTYVLACGAVANAHQLLLSNVGNDHVGRHFICHPIAGQVYTITPKIETILTPAEIMLMTSGWAPNGVAPRGRFSPNRDAQTMWKIGGCWFGVESDKKTHDSGYYFEMAPNPKSRVTLDDKCDEVFCQKRTKITWELSDCDEQTYTHSTMLYKNAIEKLAMERGKEVQVSFAPWDKVKSNLVINGHHIGTTRMSDKAEDGVVDKNLKVHSLDNLYVAGSSVFPSAGISNPTFTIVTLSIRLAEHLSKVL